RKGQYGALPQAGFPLGLLLANLAFWASAGLAGDWVWRVPFLLSGLLIAAGIYIRLRITESPEFESAKEAGEIAENPLKDVVKSDWRNLLRAFGLRIAETAGYAVAITYLTSYVHDEGLASKSDTIMALVIAALLGFPATLLWGRLTDRIGRKPLYLFGTSLMVVMGFPIFLMANTGNLLLIVVVFVVSFTLCQNSLAGTQASWFPELFETGTRSSGASLAYQLSAVISGFTAFWAVSLYGSFGWQGPAVLFSVYGLIGLVAALLTAETNPASRRAANLAAERQALAGTPTAVGKPTGAR
uniref:MFS transporter n=1 Tax=Kineococcus sp. SYSU DK003 TaxID=3383124 RepID=UPI003D7DAFDD